MTNTLIVVALVAGLILLLVIKLSAPKRRLDQAQYAQQWQKIVDCLRQEVSYNLAIIEADKLLDRALKENNLRGQTMAERLVSAASLLSAKEDVWQVHKLRNRLVHEVDVRLSLKQAKRALSIFRRALRDLGALPR